MVAADGADDIQEFDIIPGEVDLVVQKTAAGAGREEMMVVMPFASHVSRPDLVDRKVLAVVIVAIPVFFLTLAMSFVVEGPNTDGPETGCAEQSEDQWQPADQIKHPAPERPIRQPSGNGPERVGDRTPFLILSISVGPDTGVCHELDHASVFALGQAVGDRLVIDIGQKTI